MLVAYYAPPATGIAAQRLAGFVRHLPGHGWDPVVVAPRGVHYHLDEGTVAELGNARVERTRNPEPSRWLRHLAGAGGAEPGPSGVAELRSVAPHGVAARVRDAVRQLAYVPDARALWIPWARRAALAVLREPWPGPRVVMSTSVPFSAHFAARGAARGAGVPWVAEYRDPWSVSAPQFGRRWAVRQLLDARMDHDLVTSADALVLTSDATAQAYRAAFGQAMRGILAVVRNGFGEILEDRAPGPDEPLRLLYSGTLLHPTYAAPLVRAVEHLAREEPGAVELDVFGPPDGWRSAGAGGVGAVRLHGVVPPGEMPAHLVRASALVLLQPDPAHAQHVAGKLYEYLGARRPVLAALPPGSEAEALLRGHGELWGIPTLEVHAVGEVLRSLLGAHRAGGLQGPRVPESAVTPLSREAQTAGLAAILDRVAGR